MTSNLLKFDPRVLQGKQWIDYSSWKMLMACPRQYYWRCEQNITVDDEKIALINGRAYHDCKACYYEEVFKGIDHDIAKAKAMDILKAEMLTIKYPDEKRNLTIAAQTMSNYLDRWREDSYETYAADGKPCVEVPFTIDLRDFILVGRIDRVTMSMFGLNMEETKTTTVVGTKWPKRMRPNTQFDTYVSAWYLITGNMPDGAILDLIPVTTKPNDMKNKAFRLHASRSVEDVENWLDDAQEWWNALQVFRDRGIFPRNTETCIPLLGYECEFVHLCSQIPAPHKCKGEIELLPGFRREEWNPFSELKFCKEEIRHD